MTEYKRDPRGFLVRVGPKRYRRGRVQWTGGESVTRTVVTNRKSGRTVEKVFWIGAETVESKRYKTL